MRMLSPLSTLSIVVLGLAMMKLPEPSMPIWNWSGSLPIPIIAFRPLAGATRSCPTTMPACTLGLSAAAAEFTQNTAAARAAGAHTIFVCNLLVHPTSGISRLTVENTGRWGRLQPCHSRMYIHLVLNSRPPVLQRMRREKFAACSKLQERRGSA